MSRLLNARRGYTSREVARKRQAFDKDSGLAYSEVVSQAGPMTADWVWKTRGCTGELGRFRSFGPGCSSLQDMAIRCLCTNIYFLTSDSFDSVPWRIGLLVWRKIVALDLDSLHTWRVFVTAYSADIEEEALRTRRQLIAEPNMALPDYIKPITSTSFHWITFLTLSHITCSRSDLVNVSKLTNLGVLTIGRGVETSDVGFDDNIVRAWSRAADESSAFSLLRVLAFHAQKDITFQSFRYLERFPTLALFIVESGMIGSQDKSAAKKLGWSYSAGKALSQMLVDSGSQDGTWYSTIQSYFKQGSQLGVSSMTVEAVSAIDSLPVLSFSLGAVTEDAKVDAAGKQYMRCFTRDFSRKSEFKEPIVLPKRPRSDTRPSRLVKRRVMRVVREQNVESSLADFSF